MFKLSSQIFILVLLQVGCASTRMSDSKADRLYREGDYDQSVEVLKKGLESEKGGNDELLYLLDLGLVLHTAGKYEESNRYFMESDKIAEINDYTSLQTEAASLLVGDNIDHYKGEDFEKVMINVYLALNFIQLGNKEGAMVEAKKVNRKLLRMIDEGKRPYKLNAFASYLIGLLYEVQGEPDNAYVSYKQVLELEPGFLAIGQDLWRTAWLSKRKEDLSGWESRFQITADQTTVIKSIRTNGTHGEVVVVFQNGISPIKKPSPQWNSIPKFYPRGNPVQSATVYVNGQSSVTTQTLHDVEATAIHNLDEKYAAIVAKKIGGVVAKEIVADQVARQTESPLLGALIKLGLYASDQADVRSWNLLPKDLQIARIPLIAGEHTIALQTNPSTGPSLGEWKITLAPGERKIIVVRFVPKE